MTAKTTSGRRYNTATESADRLRALLDLHFHPQHGSKYWLQRQTQLGWNVCDRVRTDEDLWLLGPTPTADLRRTVLDFIPQAFHGCLEQFVVGETAGTSGSPCATAYRDDEFQAAFVDPFLLVTGATGFPRGLPWLWVGPSGPHIIGKAVRELARQTGSMDPFSVDFDPRWAKKLAERSMARRRYLDHVTTQVRDVLEREAIGVLFTTPPALTALAQTMSDHQRESLRGVHYGGLLVTASDLNHFRQAFPNAVHLSGYGNTLFGVVMEVADEHRLAVDYFPLGERLRFHVVDGIGPTETPSVWPPIPTKRGGIGRVVFDRLDESCLLIGVIERDEAERIAPSAAARALGVRQDGLRDPRPPLRTEGKLQLGIY
jgi:thienamycin biosynthesis protein ThnN